MFRIVDVHWAEVCDSLTFIEELSEDATFPAADLAAAIASKCFFHLQSYSDSLKLALSSGKYLNLSAKNEYVDTIIAQCLDEYKSLRLKQQEGAGAGAEAVTIDPRMEAVIEAVFKCCYADRCFEQAIGVALDTRRIDKLEEACREAISANREDVLGYTYNLCQGARHVPNRDFRLAVIDVLVKMYGTLTEPDFSNVCFALQYLNRPFEVAQTLYRLCNGSETSALRAFQIAFDMQEAENQGFVLKVVAALKRMIAAASNSSGEATPATPGPSVAAGGLGPLRGLSVELPGPDSNEPSPSGSPVFLRRQNSEIASTPVLQMRVGKLEKILLESFDVDLILLFLFKENKSDIAVMNDIKSKTETFRKYPAESSVLLNAAVIANSYMYCGTTHDSFLKSNLEWLRKASLWAKFTAVASIGVIHKGHVHESMNLLAPYLPQGGQSTSPYSESGALYALGLIHANKGGAGDSATINYLTNALRNAGNNEVVLHGSCLGLGLAAMATGDEGLFETLKGVVYQDAATAGEGAALAIGLLMLGQSDSALAQAEIPELLKYAHDTHEKITRAVGLSIAMMVYGQEDSADVIIDQLSRNRDPLLRYGGMYAIAMAYCGTSDNGAVRRLLHVGVSDVNDDVRRAAVTCVGLVMFRQPEAVPKLLNLLAESANAHVRYGAAMAIGIACVGTADKDALELLTVLITDSEEFVRSGALQATALVLQQVSEARSPSVKKFRAHLATTIGKKYEYNCANVAKTGAILASGILDAGGRNCVVSLQSRAGFMKMGAAVGVMMWLQSWYWHPLNHLLSLAFAPTMLIGLNKDFDIPIDFAVTCNCPPSMFAYPKEEEKKDDEKKLVATAVLSTTARAKARERRKESGKLDAQALGSPIPVARVESYLSTTSGISIGDENQEKPEDAKQQKKEKEPHSFEVKNHSRLLHSQHRFIRLIDENQRYRPVDTRSVPAGIVMLIDTDPTAPENVRKAERVEYGAEEEAPAPEPFEWDPRDA